MTDRITRNHIILIPGFAGFDALGQIFYYPGITEEYLRWKDARRASRSPVDHMEFHYFDNLPTASVKTRANRLKNFLAKGIARGDFWCDNAQNHDNIMLVGHSTGGLDIRQLLYDLDRSGNDPIVVDGDVSVAPSKILTLIKHLVFLSVPQFGTNIANWIMNHDLARTVLMNAVAMLTPAIVDFAPGTLVNPFPVVGLAPNLRMAIEDTVRESSPQYAGNNPILLANAREAASKLKLYLDGISRDFSAISDLQHTTVSGNDIPASPAHFTPAMRQREKNFWKQNNISTSSYATLGKRPFNLPQGHPAPEWYLPGDSLLDIFNPWKLWDLLNPWNLSTGIDLANRILLGNQTFDSTYLLAYRACAGGNFDFSYTVPQNLKSIDGNSNIPVNIKGQGTGTDIEQWDNDGIVNTLSQLWPDGSDTRLVQGDHADIIGHFADKPASGPIRQHFAYDIFVSSESPDPYRFDANRFTEVWTGIFNECARL